MDNGSGLLGQPQEKQHSARSRDLKDVTRCFGSQHVVLTCLLQSYNQKDFSDVFRFMTKALPGFTFLLKGLCFKEVGSSIV